MPSVSRLLESDNWSLRLTSNKDDAKRFNAWIDTLSKDAALSRKAAFDLKLFFDEALGNVFEYGFADGRTHTVDLRVECDQKTVWGEVIDDGPAFDPTAITSRKTPTTPEEVTVGGWGIELMRKISEELVYERKDDQNRLRVRFPR
jgi:serine/threonine-protein kinase RsbW